MNPSKKYNFVEMDETALQAMLAAFAKGDQRCRFQRGDKVVKSRQIDANETNPIGTKGIVRGCVYNPDMPGEQAIKEMYLIQWEGDKHLTHCSGLKIAEHL